MENFHDKHDLVYVFKVVRQLVLSQWSLKLSSVNSDLGLSFALQLFACQRQGVLSRCTESPRPLNINKVNGFGYSFCLKVAVT